MSWLEVDWKQDKPGDDAIESLWRSMEIRALHGTPAVLAEFLSELRRLYRNGGVLHARFEVAGNSDFDWFATRNRWDEIAFFPRFLAHPAVAAALPDVTRDARFDDEIVFKWGTPLTLDGDLAFTLVRGGAYERFKGTPKEAKALGARVCEALFDDRYSEVEIFTCWRAWSPWFQDVIWDPTFVLIDRRHRTVALIVASDSD